MKSCAYCTRLFPKLTKEHTVNKSFLKKFFPNSKGYLNDKEQHTIDYSTTKDVCEKCNNESLSLLDSYFLKFYEDNLPTYKIADGTTIGISYDFDLLSKWLLKTLYNSERANGYDNLPKKMRRFAQYVLGKDKRTTLFRIYLELLQDISEEEIRRANPDLINVPEKIEYLRLGNSVFSDELNNNNKQIVKYITTSNFVFHIFIFDAKQNTANIQNKVVAKYITYLKGKNLCLLEPRQKQLSITSSTRNIIDVIQYSVEGNKTAIDRMADEYIKTHTQ